MSCAKSDTHDEKAFRRILANQLSRHPRMEIQDLYKLIHQAALGSEHAVRDVDAARSWLEQELSQLAKGPDEPVVDAISPDGRIVRVNLRPYLVSGGDPSLLLDAFIETANVYPGTEHRLRRYWSYAERMMTAGELPFAQIKARTFFETMQAEGFPAAHHSSGYGEAYHPAYRVVAREFLVGR